MEVPPEKKLALDIDYRSNQTIQHQNPIEKYRQPTDRSLFFVFPVIVIVWLTFCILGFTAPRSPSGEENNILTYIQWCLNAPLHRFSGLLIFPFIITTALVWLCLIMTEKYTKLIISIGLGLFLLGTISCGFQALAATVHIFRAIERGFYLFIAIIVLVYKWIATVYMVSCSYCFLKVDKTILCDLTKDSCRAILRRPSIIFFTCLIIILTNLVIVFTGNALIFHMYTADSATLNTFYVLATLFGGICVVSFLTTLAIVVVSEFAINYYWNKDEETSSHFSVVNVLRYHIGTIMFSSTAFISLICGIVQAFKHKQPKNRREHSFIHFISKIYLVVRIPEIALIFTSIYGTDFIKSSKTAFDVVLRRPSLFLATIAASKAVLYIPIILMAIESTVIALIVGLGVEDLKSLEVYKTIALLVYGMIYPFSIYVLLLWFTMKALVINKIIMLNKEDRDNEGKTQIVN